jgi:hypothetical protein
MAVGVGGITFQTGDLQAAQSQRFDIPIILLERAFKFWFTQVLGGQPIPDIFQWRSHNRVHESIRRQGAFFSKIFCSDVAQKPEVIHLADC